MSAAEPTGDALAAFIDATAAAIALPLDPALRDGVAGHVARLLSVAALVAEFPLAEDVEVAPVFRP